MSVENPPPVVTVPENVTATVGVPVQLSVSASAESGIASVAWAFNYLTDDYEWIFEPDPTIIGLTPMYTFDYAGEYDVLVTVTDNAGKSTEEWFHVSVAPAPVVNVIATRQGGAPIGSGVDEGTTVTFTVTDLSWDDLDTVTLYADWGDGIFTQLNEAGVDFVVSPSNPDVVSFDHRFDNDSGAGAFAVRIRAEDEWGVYDSDPISLVVRNVAPTAVVQAGTQIATVAVSNQNVWAVSPGQNVELFVTDPSKEDTAGLVYQWTITDQATGAVTQLPTATDNPKGSAFVPLPLYRAGKIYTVEASVSDDRVTVQIPAFTVVVDAPSGYGGGAGSHWLPNKIYGTLTIDGLPPPAVYNRYALDVRIEPQDPAHPSASNWGAGQPITAHFELDPASQALAARPGVTVDYRFIVQVYDVEQFSSGSNNYTLLLAESRFIHGPNGTLSLPAGFGEDREVHIYAAADLILNGQVIHTTSTADFERNAFGNFNQAHLLHQPGAVLITPKTLTTWQQTVDTFAAVRDLATQFAEKAQLLIDAITSDPGRVFNVLTQAFKGAISQFGTDLPNLLKTELGAWLSGGTIPARFSNLNWDSSEQWGSFLLEYAGLTPDHVMDVIRQELGAGNLAALEEVAGWFIGSNGAAIDFTQPTSIQTFLNNVKDKVPGLDLDLSTMADDVVKEVAKRIPAALAKAGAQLAAKFVPGAGLAVSLYKGLEWVLNNRTELNAVFVQFKEAIDNVYAATRPGANEADQIKAVQAKLLAGFKAVTVPLLNLGVAQLGLARLPGELKKAVSFVPTQVDKAIKTAVSKIAAKLTGAGASPAVPGGTAGGLFDGRLAPAKEFVYRGTTTYVLWTAQDKTGVKVKLAKKTGANTYTFVGEVTVQGLVGNRADAQLNGLLSVARELHQKSKKNPSQPTNSTTVPELLVLSRKVEEWQAKVVQAMQAHAFGALASNCFAAGTKILTRAGWRNVEDIRSGEEVLSRPESDPTAEAEWKVVEERFERFGCVLHLHFPDGELIRTTEEHPFWVRGKGWTSAGALSDEDQIATLSGEWVPVTEVFNTGEWELLYNLRVADHHTYFVGEEAWGWAAWAHNTYITEIDFLSWRKVVERVNSQPGAVGKLTSSQESLIVEHIMDPIVKYGRVGDLTALVEHLTYELWFEKNDLNYVADLRSVLITRSNAQPVRERQNEEQVAIGELGGVAQPPTPLKKISGWTAYIYRQPSPLVPLTDTVKSYRQRTGLGNQDALHQTWEQYIASPPTPGRNGYLEHGHHIVYKSGSGDTLKRQTRDARDILLYYGINPYWGSENLAYAPNSGSTGHTEIEFQDVYNKIVNAYNLRLGRAIVVTILQDEAQRWIGKWK